VRVAGWPPWEARPERVAQRTTGQREAERVVLVHRVGDKAQAAPGVEQAEVWRARERMACWLTAHRHRRGVLHERVRAGVRETRRDFKSSRD
jgi:hypothetical protein